MRLLLLHTLQVFADNEGQAQQFCALDILDTNCKNALIHDVDGGARVKYKLIVGNEFLDGVLQCLTNPGHSHGPRRFREPVSK